MQANPRLWLCLLKIRHFIHYFLLPGIENLQVHPQFFCVFTWIVTFISTTSSDNTNV